MAYRIPANSLQLAIKHLCRYGDTDVFPHLPEINFLREQEIEIVQELEKFDLDTYEPGSLFEGLAPKSRLGFPPPAYFGLKVGDRTDNRYASSIDGIYGYTDDCIFFSKLLSEDLTRYGNKLKTRLPSRWFSTPPHIASADFSKAQKFIPPDSSYPSWKTSFISPPEPRRVWHIFRKKKASAPEL